MAEDAPGGDFTRTISKVLMLLGVLAVVAILYAAQEVLLPMALAVLLSFVLLPMVTWLERRGLGRIAAVLVAVTFAFAIFGLLGWIVGVQLVNLLAELPNYQDTLLNKIETVRGPAGGRMSQIIASLLTMAGEMAEAVGETDDGRRVMTVRFEQTIPLPLQALQTYLGPLLAPLGTAAVVIVFVIFMLIQREDLRDRMIRLAGTGRVYVTTQAFDEAAARVSKYLLMQLVINATYGIAVTVGLAIIGVPNAILWGILAAVLRFVPYVGPWIAAVLPIVLSAVVFEGWWRLAATIGLFVVLELISNNVMEPWLYGSSTGVSVVGIIAAAVFWTWLWGPIGLVLSTPLTVCLTVLGRHVPQLNFLNVLLSDQPALELNVRLYQRLLAFDDYEANEVARSFLRTGTLDELYESMFIPALSLAERDRQAGRLTDHQQRFIHRVLRDLIEGLQEEFSMSAAIETAPAGAAQETVEPQPDGKPRPRSLRLLCIPAEDTSDQLAGRMIAQLLTARGHEVETLDDAVIEDGMPEVVRHKQADGAIISALAPGGAIPARDGCRRLRSHRLMLPLIVGLWNASGPLGQTKERLHAAGANLVTTSLSEAIEHVQELAQRAAEKPAAVSP
jgi:predicted PurR-regulated permease PerM